jgi:hypothetical protein
MWTRRQFSVLSSQFSVKAKSILECGCLARQRKSGLVLVGSTPGVREADEETEQQRSESEPEGEN